MRLAKLEGAASVGAWLKAGEPETFVRSPMCPLRLSAGVGDVNSGIKAEINRSGLVCLPRDDQLVFL